MKKIFKILSVCFILLVLGLFGLCSLVPSDDTSSTKYQTYAEAQNKGLFDQGWLPPEIPPSARDIFVSNDLDLNTSDGEFEFSPADAQSFISKLKPAPEESSQDRRLDQGYQAFEFRTAKTRWIFFINSEKGHARYNMLYAR